ncbi:MAG TPA: hypothetical protein VKM35_07985 [Arenimonas sp.]|uniref:hypothetical protein n=1 Tax=Arenimonas sp. TaxID=1872635 RepID=UPI002BFF4065|nr:hypothetical protein [Arenimonas sp.]HMB57136.1 hypothetical protein [Arenimonas sp.]
MNALARFVAPALLLLLVACGSGNVKNSPDKVFFDYNGAIRWSEFDQAWAFVDPAVRIEKPLTDLERERFKQIQVTGYEVKSRDDSQPGIIDQVVEIRLIGKNTQAERTILDHQTWRWDEAGKHWWLMSGLPNFDNQ